MAVAGVAAWTFLAGGILDRLARQRRTGGPAFFAACRHHFWPLARLAALAGAMYWFLLRGCCRGSSVTRLPRLRACRPCRPTPHGPRST